MVYYDDSGQYTFKFDNFESLREVESFNRLSDVSTFKKVNNIKQCFEYK